MKRFAFCVVQLWLAVCLVRPAVGISTISIQVGTVPKFVAVNQNTNRIYVSNLNSNNVSVIDGATNQVVATVPVGNSPEVVDVNSATNMVYVANIGDNTVSVIDGNTNKLSATITGLFGPFGVAVNSTTNQIFVSNNNTGNVAVIDGATNTILTNVTAGSGSAGVRVNSKANLVYVANNIAGTISVIDSTSDTVTNTFTLPQHAAPIVVALDPTTSKLFVTDAANAVVYVLDASAGTLLKTITGGKVPFKAPVYVTMFQPEKTVLVSDDSSLSAVMEINESSYAAIGGLKGGSGTYGIAVNRKTGKIYVAESSTGTVNVYSGFGTPAARSSAQTRPHQ
jgi:YVTN family beta-propeller protein